MSLETCPWCRKPFKRLKAHLPHCKMSPGSKTAEIPNKPKQILTITFKHTSNKDKANKAHNNTNTDTNPIYQENSKSMVKSKSKKGEKMSMDKEFLQNTSCTSPASKIPSTEGTNTDAFNPKTKWLAKREQETLKRAKMQIQTNILTSVSQQKKHNSETDKKPGIGTPSLKKEIVSVQKNLTGISFTSQRPTNMKKCSASEPLQRDPQTTDWQVKLGTKHKANTNISEQIENIPKPLSKKLGSSVKEQDVSVFQSKTCVWDHIKHGLYKRRHDCVPGLFPIDLEHKVSFTKCVNTSESVFKPHTGNAHNATMKTSPEQFQIFQTPLPRPGEGMSVMAYSPDMATGYGGTFFFSSYSEISHYDNLLMKCHTSKPSLQSQGLFTEPRLGDVRLNKLASWLVARTPNSPREVVTVFKKGWHWYYRKYIDVQKAGIGGIAMLIGSYCVLSYILNYPHIKKDRWRKYH